MRAVIQRVTESSVSVDGEVLGTIGAGYMVLLGVSTEDDEEDARVMADKIIGLRIFNDDEGKFNRSLLDVGGAVLMISQFTLLGDARKGRRPSFVHAARPEQAVPLYEAVMDRLKQKGVHVEAGSFGAHMDVHLVNDGPVTIMLDTKKTF